MTADETSESVKVIVRCRPFNQREKDLRCKAVVGMDPNRGEVSIRNPNDEGAPPKTFTFDGVYDIDSGTGQIYNDIVYPLVEGVLEAYSGTVFAYGQTGCGKSYTMLGPCATNDPSGPQSGIIPRAFEHIFEAIATSDDTRYLVHASYLEIYNEEIRDLLGKDTKRKLELKDHPTIGAFIPGLSKHAVHNVAECLRLMQSGWRNRSVGSTLMNADSSRSHSVFTVSLEMMPIDGGEPTKGKLNLVDLAGSERQTKTGCTGDRLKEATKINLSLSALGNVISALVDGKSKHIPYRDSKLTRLLQDSLGGETRTLMVACLSPADNNYDETLSTLRYANRAKKIVNKPVKNENPVDALLREYREEIDRLKAIVEAGGSPDGGPRQMAAAMPVGLSIGTESVAAQHTSHDLEEERNRLKMEYEQMMEDLRDKYEREQRSHAMLQQELTALRVQYEQQMQHLKATHPPLESVAEVAAIGVMPATAEVLPESSQQTNSNHEFDEKTASASAAAAALAATTAEPTRTTPKPEAELNNALKRLQELEEQMVGGEKANDKELKEKRLRKKMAAEKRLHLLADALQQVDEDDKALLTVYDSIQEELKAKTELLKKEKQRVRALEREIKDLQSEFEFDRMDYLETIRRQDHQNRLLEQILEKVQPCLRRDCNYSSVDRVKAESTWDEDAQRWILPELVVAKTRLPAAAAATTVANGFRQIATAVGRSRADDATTMSDTNHDHYDDDAYDDKFLQKLERGEQEDIAGKYFRTRRAKELLLRAQGDGNGNTGNSGIRLSNLRNMNNGLANVGGSVTNGIGGGSNGNGNGGGGGGGGGSSGYFHNAMINGNFDVSVSNSSPLLMSSDNGNNGRRSISKVALLSDPTSPELNGLIRKPIRLDALDSSPLDVGGGGSSSNRKLSKRKKTHQNMNSMTPPGAVLDL